MGNQEIASLLLQGLDDSRKQVIQLAACCRWFDQKLIESLAQQFKLSVDFDWLRQQSFVEQKGFQFRLDDVARDVFRQTFYQHDRTGFERTFDLLMRYFKAASDREVPSKAAPPDKYENPDWRTPRTKYLYYLLFARPDNLQLIWIEHLLEARYFNQDQLVQIPLQTVEGEAELDTHPYLSFPTRQFLQRIRPAVEHGWAVLEQDPLDYAYNQSTHGLTRSATQAAIELCLGKVDNLTGLAKFAALFYRSRRCPDSERFDRLLAAKAQAEQIATATHPEFSSGLFLWEIGNALSALGRHEDAITAYDQAIHFKADDHQAWYNKGNALSALGRHEDAITAYDQAIAIKPDKYNAWDNRGDVLVDLKQYEAAVESFDRAIAINPSYRFPHQSRGFALMQLGRYPEALESFDRAIELKPDYERAHYNKACCLALQGDIIEAVASLSRAIELDPENREMAKTDTDFDGIREEDWFRLAVEGGENERAADLS